MTVSETLQSYTLTEEERNIFLPHPGHTGNAVSEGQHVFGHATTFEEQVIKVRLFTEEEEAERDFSEFPHPHGNSVLFEAEIAEIDGGLQLSDVEVLDVEEPKTA